MKQHKMILFCADLQKILALQLVPQAESCQEQADCKQPEGGRPSNDVAIAGCGRAHCASILQIG